MIKKPMNDIVMLLGFVVAIMIISAVVQALWSLSGLLGLMFVFIAIYLVLKKGGAVTIAKNQPYLLFLILGVVFLFLSYTGVQIIDISGTPNPLEFLIP